MLKPAAAPVREGTLVELSMLVALAVALALVVYRGWLAWPSIDELIFFSCAQPR